MRSVLKGVKRAVLHRLPVRSRRIPFGVARGVRMHVDFQHDTAFYFGLYEVELSNHYRALVHPRDRCFDVGAHRGWDSLLLSKLNNSASVVAFECNREHLPTIENNASLNGFDVRVAHALVGDRSGEGWITLDEAARQYFVPDFIKMDIEGAEAQALEGAREILSVRRPSLLVEVHGREVEDRCQEILTGHGYNPIVVDQRHGLIKEARAVGHNRWLVAEGSPARH